MGSVIESIECPYCGWKHAFFEIYYKSNEEYIFCSECGYSYSRDLINWESVNDGEEPEYREVIIDNPYGCCHSTGLRSFTMSIESKEALDDVVAEIKNDTAVETLQLTQYVGKKKYTKTEVYNRKKYIRKQKLLNIRKKYIRKQNYI